MKNKKPGRKSLFFLGLLLFATLFSCTEWLGKEPEKPENFIPRDTMVHILLDMQLLEEITAANIGTRDEKEEERYFLFYSIMEKYNITREQFKENYYYYKDDFEALKSIYEDVGVLLEEMKNEIDQERKTSKSLPGKGS